MVLSEKQRLFIGLAVPDDVRRQLLMRLDGWRERFAFARWAHPDDWHITLHFIGETDADRIPAIVRALDESAAGARPFDVELRGLGTFGPPARPAVLHVLPAGRLEPLRALHAAPVAARRVLAGPAPGVHVVDVVHEGNAVESREEAAAVVAIVRDQLGRAWLDPSVSDEPRPLTAADVIVVAPYNAQVDLLRRTLDAAGLPETRVGTVDRFQGQEAVIAVVSLTASSADDAPRGIDFVLQRNRINVAISRAQWAAYVVHSPRIADALPYKADGLAQLSAL